MYEIGYRDPEEYKIIRLFHEILEVMVKYGHNEMDLIEISVMLSWTTSRQRKLISNDSELYSVFEEFFTNSCPTHPMKRMISHICMNPLLIMSGNQI